MGSLSVVACESWRTFSARIATYGIVDPFALPSLHRLLDVIETIILESKANSDDRDAVQRAIFELYRPDTDEEPEGFSDEESMASFVALEAAMKNA